MISGIFAMGGGGCGYYDDYYHKGYKGHYKDYYYKGYYGGWGYGYCGGNYHYGYYKRDCYKNGGLLGILG